MANKAETFTALCHMFWLLRHSSEGLGDNLPYEHDELYIWLWLNLYRINPSLQRYTF